MHTHATSRLDDFSWFRHCTAPALALLCGAMAYLLTRDMLPQALLPLRDILGANTSGGAPISLPFSGQLPSFFHALAILLLTQTLTYRDPAWQTPAWLIMLALVFAMELLQLNWVETYVIDHWTSTAPSLMQSWPVKPVVAYASDGTFDPLDLAAIGLAALLVRLASTRRAPVSH